MSKKIAGASALLVFAVCLIFGLMADNTISTILSRSLLAMAATLIIGLVIGTMAEKMMLEHRNLIQARQAAEPVAGEAPGQENAKDAGASSSDRTSANRRKTVTAPGESALASNRLASRTANDKQKNGRIK